MPFGDNVRTYRALVDRENFDPQRDIPARRVAVPEVDPPPWWSEYLLEEWKRKNRLERRPRQASPGRQADEQYRRDCAWMDTQRRWHNSLRDVDGLHAVWGNFAKEKTAR